MFWTRLLELCDKQGIAPTQLATAIGLSTGTPTRWKNGSIPQSRILYRIAEYFGVTTSYLLEETDIKTAAPTDGAGLSEIKRKAVALIEQMTDEECTKLVEFLEMAKK